MYRTSYVRRGVGALLCAAPLLLLGSSIVRAVTSGDRHGTPGLTVILVAIGIGALNFYLSFIRGLSFRRTRGSLENYKHVSGIPLVGTVLVVVGAVLGFGSALCAGLGLLAVALDTGGSVWFLIATWKDSSLWDRPRDQKLGTA